MFLVVGSTTIDLFVSGVERLPGWGGEEFAIANLATTDQPLRLRLGGNGANTALALGRLGAPVQLLSAVGQDPLGDLACGWLADAGVTLAPHLRRRDRATAATVLVVDDQRNRLIFLHPGAYPGVTLDDLEEGWQEGLRALLITGYTLMHGLRPAGYAALLQAAQAAGAHTAVDIGPAFGQVARLDELAPLLPWIDTLIANTHELAACVGGPEGMGIAARAAALHAAGARRLVVKQGGEGATLFAEGAPLHVPARRVPVRQTVGAGDTFNAGLLYALAQGWDDAAALRFAHAAAACVVMSDQGILDAPTRAAVEAMLDGTSGEDASPSFINS